MLVLLLTQTRYQAFIVKVTHPFLWLYSLQTFRGPLAATLRVRHGFTAGFLQPPHTPGTKSLSCDFTRKLHPRLVDGRQWIH